MKINIYSKPYSLTLLSFIVLIFLVLLKIIQKYATPYGLENYFGAFYLLIVILIATLFLATLINNQWRKYNQKISNDLIISNLYYFKLFILTLIIIGVVFDPRYSILTYLGNMLFRMFGTDQVVHYIFLVLLIVIFEIIFLLFIYPNILKNILLKNIDIEDQAYEFKQQIILPNKPTRKLHIWVFFLFTVIFTPIYANLNLHKITYPDIAHKQFSVQLPSDWPQPIPINTKFLAENINYTDPFMDSAASDKNEAKGIENYLRIQFKKSINNNFLSDFQGILLKNKWTMIDRSNFEKDLLLVHINAGSTYFYEIELIDICSQDFQNNYQNYSNSLSTLFSQCKDPYIVKVPQKLQLPKYWPKEFVIYPNSFIDSIVSYEPWDISLSLKLSTDDEVEDIQNYFKDKLLKKGWKIFSKSSTSSEYRKPGSVIKILFFNTKDKNYSIFIKQ